MEDDDEFGDLYTDVLKPLTTQSTPPLQPTATSSRPIDLNIHSDDEEILYGAPSKDNNQSNFKISLQTPKPSFDEEILYGASSKDNNQSNLARVLGSNGIDESDIDFVVEERDENVQTLDNFGGNNVIDDMGMETVIPGVSNSMPRILNRDEGGGGAEGEGDDWDSDSDDDLQIVLNENTDIMGMDRADDEVDENGEPLVIVAGNDPNHQLLEEQDWGEDAAQAVDGGGEKKDIGDSTAKVNGGGSILAPKLGYNSSHGYHHPFHSQFKYVRPGAVPLPGAAPATSGGVPSQVRPPVGMAPFAGRGRGDWRPSGIRGATPMQKNFHPGYGAPAWGNGGAGRGFGSGLDFTLPSHKTIFEVDIDGFEEKPWRLQGIDLSDFFNFDLNEESWKEYCKQLDQLRLEATMKSKIRVYESGRAEQEYDPDLPPELAAAAGIHDGSAENSKIGKVDSGQSDLANGSVRARQQMPGRAIQVETGNGERLPSFDTRPPRMRDFDAIIEIVLQDSGDDDSYAVNDVAEQLENGPSKEVSRGAQEIEEDTVQEEADRFDGAVAQDLSDSRGKIPAYSGRKHNVPNDERTNRKPDRSPDSTYSGSMHEKPLNNQKGESVESVERNRSPLPSPVTGGSTEEREIDQNDARNDEVVAADGSSEAEGVQALDKGPSNKPKTDNSMYSMKKQKLIPRERPSVQEIDEVEDSKAVRSSENSKARSGSSRDYQDMRDSVDEEVVQVGRPRHMGMDKRFTSDDEHTVHSRGRYERRETERLHSPMKGRENSYSRKKWDPNMGQHPHSRGESLDRRKDSEPYGVWKQKDEDLHDRRTRADDFRKRERGEEPVIRHRSKVHENERSDKDDYQSRKALENGNWKGYHEKDLVTRHEDRDANLKIRNDNFNDPHSKRRKEEVHLRRDHAEKEERLHGQKESTARRKRERDDILDPRRRGDDQVRLREDNKHIVRHNKEEVWLERERVERQRERDEWQRLKQSQEENLIKRDREGRGGGVRNGRLVEDKAWANQSRVKEEYKGGDREHQMKDIGRHIEQINRRDRVDSESLPRHRGRGDAYVRGNQLNNDDRRSRQERGSTFPEEPVSISNNHGLQEKNHKDNLRKIKESEIGDHTSLATSRRNREDHSGQKSERVSGKRLHEQGINEPDNAATRQTSSKKHKENVLSDDEQQDSRRGRSKFERWTSHTERDFGIGIKSSAPLNVKKIDKYNNNGGPSLAIKVTNEASRAEEIFENSQSQVEQIDDAKPSDNTRLDTVERLKKRSERFKLPMPGEKEGGVAIKKIENEPLPPPPLETRSDLEVKQERPARKRRWTGS